MVSVLKQRLRIQYYSRHTGKDKHSLKVKGTKKADVKVYRRKSSGGNGSKKMKRDSHFLTWRLEAELRKQPGRERIHLNLLPSCVGLMQRQPVDNFTASGKPTRLSTRHWERRPSKANDLPLRPFQSPLSLWSQQVGSHLRDRLLRGKHPFLKHAVSGKAEMFISTIIFSLQNENSFASHRMDRVSSL